MVIYEPNGNPRRRADAAHGDSFVTVFFQAAKGGLDQRFAAYRRRRTAKFRYMPLFLHVIPFIPKLSEPHPGVLEANCLRQRDRRDSPSPERFPPPRASIVPRAHSGRAPPPGLWKLPPASHDRRAPSRKA